jgi:Gti1/Pac2 family transcription factor
MVSLSQSDISSLTRYPQVYREINERASSRGSHKKYTGDERALSIHRNSPGLSATGFKGGPTGHNSGSDQGTFKPNGLIKKVCYRVSSCICTSNSIFLWQTITVTIDGSDLHLISYYTSEDIRSGRLKVRYTFGQNTDE